MPDESRTANSGRHPSPHASPLTRNSGVRCGHCPSPRTMPSLRRLKLISLVLLCPLAAGGCSFWNKDGRHYRDTPPSPEEAQRIVEKELRAARKDLYRLNRGGSARVQGERADILDEQEEWSESGQRRAKKEIKKQRKKFDKERADATRKGDETLRDLAKQGAAQSKAAPLKRPVHDDDQSVPGDTGTDAASASPNQSSLAPPTDLAAPVGPSSPAKAVDSGPQETAPGDVPSAEARSALPTIKLSPP